jgi:hypothetical protein
VDLFEVIDPANDRRMVDSEQIGCLAGGAMLGNG